MSIAKHHLTSIKPYCPSSSNYTLYNMFARDTLVRTSGTFFLLAFGKGPFLLPYLPEVRTSPRITYLDPQRKLSFYKD